MVYLIRLLCDHAPNVQCIATSICIGDAVELCQEHCPDVLVVEVNDYVPLCTIIKRAREVCPNVRVVVLDITPDPYGYRDAEADIRLEYNQIQEVPEAILRT